MVPNEGRRLIMGKTFIIAEAGSTWNWTSDCSLSRRRAMKMVQIAYHAGADAVKFQWCSNPGRMEQRRNVPAGSYGMLAWPEPWHGLLRDFASELGIEYMCTVYLPEDVARIDPYIRRHKVASLELMDGLMWHEIGKTTKQVVCSFGAVGEHDMLKRPFCDNECVWLQCTASYPCSPDHVNLGVLRGDTCFDGLSDHTGNVVTGALAVAAGATMLEVHYRLDETPRNNPDFPHSHSPERLREYIANVRLAETMIGDGIKKVEPSEVAILKHRVVTT